MDAPVAQRPIAWQPLTPRGVAAFASATLGRLLAVQMVFALFAAAAVVWFLSTGWFPTIRSAINELPLDGKIASGKLDWPDENPKLLAEGRFLSFAIDLKHEGGARSPAHVQIEFGERDFQVRSLLGFWPWNYRPDWNVPFDRDELAPWWGAWAPEILGITAGAVFGGLIVIWALLASIYSAPAWLTGFFGNRDLSYCGSWRLSGAALMPGALFFVATILLYGLGALDLVQLAVATGIHIVLGWVYVVAGALARPLHPEAAASAKNPFHPAHPDTNQKSEGPNPNVVQKSKPES